MKSQEKISKELIDFMFLEEYYNDEIDRIDRSELEKRDNELEDALWQECLDLEDEEEDNEEEDEESDK